MAKTVHVLKGISPDSRKVLDNLMDAAVPLTLEEAFAGTEIPLAQRGPRMKGLVQRCAVERYDNGTYWITDRAAAEAGEPV